MYNKELAYKFIMEIGLLKEQAPFAEAMYRGLSYREIGKELNCEEKAVQSNIVNVYRALKVNKRTQLINKVMEYILSKDEKSLLPKCTNCGSFNLAIEKKPDSDAFCIDCKNQILYSKCFY